MNIQSLKTVVFTISILGFNQLNAQKLVSFPTYKEALRIVNPASTGVTKKVGITTLVRSQWSAMEDPPKAQFLSFGMPIDKNISLGFSILNDKYHITRDTEFFADISYGLNLGKDKTLYFGLKGGGSIVSVDFQSLELDDSLFKDNVTGDFNPNFGTGIHFQTKKYFLSIAVPRILKTRRYDKEKERTIKSVDNPQIFLNSAYIFDLNNSKMEMSLIPSLMIRHDLEQQTTIELATVFEMMNKFELGIAKRFKESFSVLATFKFMDNYKFGYVYESAISGFGITHQVILKATF